MERESMENAENYCMVVVTIDTPENARTLAQALISEALAACCNLLPGISSIYSWQGTIEESSEVLMLIKTRRDNLDATEERIRSLHPYQVPEIIAINLDSASAPYLAWMNSVIATTT